MNLLGGKKEQAANAVASVPAPKKRKWWRAVVAVVAAVAVFQVGVNVGNGTINVGPDAIFRKPVQKGLPKDLNYASVEAVYDKLRLGFDGQMDQTKLLDGLKAGLASATGDPYTEYMNADGAKEFNAELSGTFTGIGAELGKDQNGNIIVIAPIAGYPAEKAGIRAKDLIAEVDGESTVGKSITEVVKKIRGPADTKVKLQVIRDGSQTLNLELTREAIKIPSVNSEILDGNIGYVRITRFSDDTTALAQTAANNFKQAGVKGVILDLRDDPGGLLPTAVDIASLWLDPDQTVLQEKRGGEVIKTFRAQGSPTLKGIPTVVLINAGSASASEIVAGALHDNKAATLLGTKSFGKGSVQELDDLGDGSVLKVTIAHWFTPSGRGIDKQGLEPDQKVDRSDDDFKAGRDPQKDTAIQKLKQ
jgi:carboxyl-terminal processing protease